MKTVTSRKATHQPRKRQVAWRSFLNLVDAPKAGKIAVLFHARP
jgi:hypothetical protein